MPDTVTFYRPQTIKEAKKAYRKSGAGLKLSASELAIVERRAVLQERADNIKEREARRKANSKRKQERKERQKEALIRVGRPLPVERGIEAGSSQLDLSRFLPVLGTTHEEINGAEGEEVPPSVLQGDQAQEANGTQIDIKAPNSKAMAPPPRPSLTQLPANSTKNRSITNGTFSEYLSITNDDPDGNLDDIFVSNTQIERELSPSPKRRLENPMEVAAPQTQQVLFPLVDASNCILAHISTQDLDFAGTFTQVLPHPEPEHALAPSATPGAQDSAPMTEYHCMFKDDKSGTGQMLAGISTQDLNFDVEVDEEEYNEASSDISTQDRDLANTFQPSQKPRIESSKSIDFDEGFTDNELEDLATELELASSSTPKDSSYEITAMKHQRYG